MDSSLNFFHEITVLYCTFDDTPKTMDSMHKKFIILILLFSVFFACNEKVETIIPTVVTNSVKKEDVKVYGEYVGNIRAYKYVEVRARVEGYLMQMLFEEGKEVKEGEALFQIDPVQFEAKYEKVKAQLKRDSAALRKAYRNIERVRPLFEQNAASQLDLDNAVAAYESAEANVAMSKAELTQAKLELDFTHVTSPIEGTISDRYVDIGTLVGPGNNSLLATVVQSDTVWVDFKMTALDYLTSKKNDISIGQKENDKGWEPTVLITLPDNSVYPLEGIVDFADPQVDPKNGTFGVRARLENPDQVLLPGQFTRVKFLLDIIEDAIVVPRKALIIEKGGSFIYVMRSDSIAEKRFVEPGVEVENSVVIQRGISFNEEIIVDGQHKLHPGLKVRPVEPTKELTQVTSTKAIQE